jgi:hypothetical protein
MRDLNTRDPVGGSCYRPASIIWVLHVAFLAPKRLDPVIWNDMKKTQFIGKLLQRNEVVRAECLCLHCGVMMSKLLNNYSHIVSMLHYTIYRTCPYQRSTPKPSRRLFHCVHRDVYWSQNQSPYRVGAVRPSRVNTSACSPYNTRASPAAHVYETLLCSRVANTAVPCCQHLFTYRSVFMSLVLPPPAPRRGVPGSVAASGVLTSGLDMSLRPPPRSRK